MKYRSMLLAGAALHAGIANGMGLGNIDVQSYLGAPLTAQIQLFSTREFDAGQIRVKLARTDVYDRFDARYEASHGDIQFDVITNNNGEKAILVRTAKRVVEPFLDIVIEMSWPTGTTYRRYNLLLDPPLYAAGRRNTQSVLSPVLAQAVANPEPQPFAQPNSDESITRANSVELDGAYVVQAGDSLWKIAKAFRAETGLSVQKTMDLLYAENPQAFSGGDRNHLKLGATLSVPSIPVQPEPRSMPVSLDQVDTQTYSQSETQIEFADTERSTVTVNPVSPDNDVEQASELERLKAQLAELKNERAQLLEFQQQIRAELAQVQNQQQLMKQTISVAEQISQHIALSDSGTAASADVAPPPSLQASPAVDPMPASNEVVEPVNMDIDVTEQEQPRLAVAQDLIADGAGGPNMLIEKSGSGFWYLLAMIPLGILIVLMGLRARKVEEIKRTEEIRDEDLYELVFGTRRDRSKSDSPEQVRQAIHHIKEKVTHQEAVVMQAKREEDEASKDDVDQMIELYILYNQYQKALNVILTEIAKRPARKDLRLYLMQVYAQTNDWKAFDEQMEVLERIGDDDLLQAASQLRGQGEYASLHRNAG
ncbi:MAG: LysM peptidoglycan-binding domain-containing protein [Ketobacter sp.]|nr:LysM peptidoglycan-binding domain-containing protein [Ketobacter sp.]